MVISVDVKRVRKVSEWKMVGSPEECHSTYSEVDKGKSKVKGTLPLTSELWDLNGQEI